MQGEKTHAHKREIERKRERETRGEAEPSLRMKIKIQTKCIESQTDGIEGSQDDSQSSTRKPA